jgi:hypothetical protein
MKKSKLTITSLSEEVAREMKNAKARARKKKKPKEDVEQMGFVRWARQNTDMVWHVPNERVGKIARLCQHAMGVQGGIPDIFVLCHGARFAFEFKREGEVASEKQKSAMRILSKYAYQCKVVYSAAEAKLAIYRHVGRFEDATHG